MGDLEENYGIWIHVWKCWFGLAAAVAWGEGERTPGPAGYAPQLTEKGTEFNMEVASGVETMKSAAFASNSATAAERGWALPSADNPGPGAYDPIFDVA